MRKKIGVWGFGIVGKSYLRFTEEVTSIYDKRALVPQELSLLKGKTVYTDLKEFLNNNDAILLSPGVDTLGHNHNYLCELDLFSRFNHDQVIAITGTLGKTTVTRLLGELLNLPVGGNIGLPMLDLARESRLCLELSSFQLQHASFAPDVAIMTNFYPNHLDWHKNLSSYRNAKLNIFKYQSNNQHAIMPANLFDYSQGIKSKIHFIGSKLSKKETLKLMAKGNVFSIDEKTLLLNGSKFFDLTNIPWVTFKENIVTILVTLHVLGFPKDLINKKFEKLHSPEIKTDPHRVEFFASFNQVDFYNDSKSTIMQSTLVALEKLSSKPTILIIGGLGKGVDRGEFIAKFRQYNVKRILCFGAKKFEGCDWYASLEEVIDAATKIAEPNDQVLFSPGGSSFDLFKNYMERGERFKALVNSYGEKFNSNKPKIFNCDR